MRHIVITEDTLRLVQVAAGPQRRIAGGLVRHGNGFVTVAVSDRIHDALERHREAGETLEGVMRRLCDVIRQRQADELAAIMKNLRFNFRRTQR